MNKLFLIVIIVFISISLFSQEIQEDTWDNQIYLGNKIAFGKNKWKFSGELQTRLKDNFQSLDNWYVELVANNLIAKNFEIVPDLRFTIKPTKHEIRPGLGILFKQTTTSLQFINQIKWQTDFPTKGDISHAFREVVFLNYSFSDKVIGTMVAGFIYRMRPGLNYFQYIRVGPGISYIFDKKHILNFSYFVGVENKIDYWMWSGIPMIQLLINISKDYTYTPAYYFEF